MSSYSQDIIAPGRHLYSDRIINRTITAGTNVVWDPVEVSGSSRLTVQCDMTGAAIGDLAITVQPYEEDNVSLSAVVLTPIQAPANVLNAGVVSAYALYDVTGLGRVKIFAKNNNAGQQTINHFSWRATGI